MPGGIRLNKKTLVKKIGVNSSTAKLRCSMWAATDRRVFTRVAVIILLASRYVEER